MNILATVVPRVDIERVTIITRKVMETMNLPNYIVGLPAFIAWFACGLFALGLFGFLYTRITKHDEIKLIREGNTAAAIGFMGVLVGYSLPLSSAAENTVSLMEFIVWAAIRFAAQVAAYFIGSLVQPGLSKRITENDIAAGISKGGFAIAVGMLNAACMTY